MNPSCCHQRAPQPTASATATAPTGDDAPPPPPTPPAPQKTWLRRARGEAGWVLPATLLALLPKCPLCLAAYVALATGVSLSGASAHLLLRTLTVLSAGTLALCVARRVVGSPQSKHLFHHLRRQTQP